MANENPTIIAGSLRRYWRNAGVPVDGVAGTLAASADKGDLLVDTTNATLYQNSNTKASPTWTLKAGSGASLSVNVADMAAAGTAAANALGASVAAAPIDHVHALGTHTHAGATTGGATLGDITASYIILANTTLPANTNAYIGRDNTGDATINALTGKSVNLAVAGVDVVTVAGALVTIAQATTISAGGLTVSAGGAAVTGNSTITGDLNVTGSLTFGGNWTVGATLTVDELILDTDGVAPAGTNAYVVSDNTGDLTVNALTGKLFHVAINNTDEYDFGATSLDMLANALDNCGFLILNAATAPAGTEVYAVNDNAGDLTLNALTGKQVNVAIAGTDEWTFSATRFTLASANFIQFLGNDAILDSNGNEILEVSATAAATNGLLVKNAATGDPVIISAQGTGATANRGIRFNDSNGNEALVLGATATAVNEIQVSNAATTTNPTIEATGGDTNIGIAFLAKGTGAFTLNNGTDPVILQFLGAQAGYNNEIQDVNGNEILALNGVASAVNELGIVNAITTANPAIIAQGGDANIGITITPKAAGQFNVAPGSAGTAAAPDVIIGGDIDSGIFGGTNIVGLATAGVEGLRVSAANNVHIANSTAAATAGTKVLYLTNAGVNPSGLISNGCALYCTAGEFYALDAAGNATLNSAHSDDGDYIAFSYSAKKDKTIAIHLEKLCRALAVKFPTEFSDLVEEFAGQKHHKADNVKLRGEV